ncbi:MAG TPA: phytoene/squalene synthase family protein [Planctomycetota bacterium]|nr:phytoene/squalene synthase family protein [Planctomycetota bacterium]
MTEELLGDLLKNVSRSFYLTVRVLPRDLRVPIGLAYLLARAADTIADTALIPPADRLDLLLGFRAHVNGLQHDATLGRIEHALSAGQSDPHERKLLQSLAPALALLDELSPTDRTEVRSVVTTLTQGMELDLRTFPDESSGQLAALKTIDDLELYTYLVAGCVGQFWTRMTKAHTPALSDWNEAEMSARGIAFGKALQYTNVLRDCPRDLRIGRCYIPSERLAEFGLQPQELLDPRTAPRVRPLLNELLRRALGHYRQAQDYLLAIPPQCGRLRLACLWPVLIGLETLKKLAVESDDWLDPEKRIKVQRGFVYRNLALSLPAVGSDRLIKRWIEGEIGAVEKRLAP